MKRKSNAGQQKATAAAKAKRDADAGLSQREKFEKAARDIEADGGEFDLARALKKVADVPKD